MGSLNSIFDLVLWILFSHFHNVPGSKLLTVYLLLFFWLLAPLICHRFFQYAGRDLKYQNATMVGIADFYTQKPEVWIHPTHQTEDVLTIMGLVLCV